METQTGTSDKDDYARLIQDIDVSGLTGFLKVELKFSVKDTCTDTYKCKKRIIIKRGATENVIWESTDPQSAWYSETKDVTSLTAPGGTISIILETRPETENQDTNFLTYFDDISLTGVSYGIGVAGASVDTTGAVKAYGELGHYGRDVVEYSGAYANLPEFEDPDLDQWGGIGPWKGSAKAYLAAVSPPSEPGFEGYQYRKTYGVYGYAEANTTGACFLEGTKVLLGSGKESPIEKLKIGDIVKSYDIINSAIVNSKVISVHQRWSNHYYVINGKIKVTGEHPFYVNGRWVKAKDLKIGMKLFNGLTEIPVTSIEKINKQVKVYNLTVDEYQNYFAEGVLVHNKTPYGIYGVAYNPVHRGIGTGVYGTWREWSNSFGALGTHKEGAKVGVYGKIHRDDEGGRTAAVFGKTEGLGGDDYAIWGKVTNPNAWAGYFEGNVKVVGNIRVEDGRVCVLRRATPGPKWIFKYKKNCCSTLVPTCIGCDWPSDPDGCPSGYIDRGIWSDKLACGMFANIYCDSQTGECRDTGCGIFPEATETCALTPAGCGAFKVRRCEKATDPWVGKCLTSYGIVDYP
jgi:hypothetical protein